MRPALSGIRNLPNVLGALLMGFSLAALGAPKAELWPRFGGSGTLAAEIDHSDWDLFVQTHVKVGLDGINRLPYGKIPDADRARLKAYLDRLQAVEIQKYPRSEQRPYWINLYNAATVQVVLDHYPVESITKINISPGFFSKGPWKKKLLTVEGEPVSLDDIEHRILRPIWRDPRIHYAVNCASIGCPNLARRAYTASRMDGLLDDGARAFIGSERGVSVKDGKLTVSSIYKWFREDFGEDDAAVISHLKKYASIELRKKLDGFKAIDADQYDWSLNDAKK